MTFSATCDSSMCRSDRSTLTFSSRTASASSEIVAERFFEDDARPALAVADELGLAKPLGDDAEIRRRHREVIEAVFLRSALLIELLEVRAERLVGLRILEGAAHVADRFFEVA